MIHGRDSTAPFCEAGPTLDQAWRLNDVEYLVLVRVDGLLEPATSAQDIFALTAGVAECHTLGASGTGLSVSVEFEAIDDAPECHHRLLVTRLMLKTTRDAIWKPTVGAFREQGAQWNS